MSIDKKKLYIISATYFAITLLVALFPGGTWGNISMAVWTAVCAAVLPFYIKKRSATDIEKKQVAMLMTVVAVISVTAFYLTGLYFGFSKVLLLGSFWGKYIIPYAVTIVSSEIARRTLLAQKNFKVSVLAYLACLASDISILSAGNSFANFSRFMDLVGMAIFPAVTANILYTYISYKYGALPNMLYRLIITLYPFLIPYSTKIPDVMLSFAKIVLPLVIYLFIHALYKKRHFVVSKRKSALNYVFVAFLLIIMIAIVMLVSCKFRYGILVVGSESMTGEVNKGDAVVYEQDDGGILQVGDVIVFTNRDTKIIHRIAKIERINGEVRYYTKGDANDGLDSGYILRGQIVGKVHLKIKFIGYPSIWCRSLFK